ncbi:MAG: ribosome assembly cofactor RimP [Bacteroidales bacterium]
MVEKSKLIDFINAKLQGDEDAFLVDVIFNSGNSIVVEIDSMSSVSIDKCIELSKALSEEFGETLDDYDFEVGSAGLTSPFKIKEQYLKNIDNDVEVLTNDGKKLKGLLTEVNDDDFTITISKRMKVEGKKRPVDVEEPLTLKYSEIKYTKYLMQFK